MSANETIKTQLTAASDAIHLAQTEPSPERLTAAAEAVTIALRALDGDDSVDDSDDDGSHALRTTVHQVLVGLLHNELVSWPSPLMRELVGDAATDEALRLTLSRVLALLAGDAVVQQEGVVITNTANAATVVDLAHGSEAGFHTQSAMGRAFAQLDPGSSPASPRSESE